jgi:hydroxyethylthiazole kinase
MEALLAAAVLKDVEQIRQKAPLVLNVTNYVAMDLTANALLSLGASPIMAHAPEELEELVQISGAVVLNMGTLDSAWAESIRFAARAAEQNNKPVVFDPVGVGASRFRTQFAVSLLKEFPLRCVRGNASEILALYGGEKTAKGVDSTSSPESVVRWLKQQGKTRETIAMSGAVDFILSDTATAKLSNGSPRMAAVTAMGCTASAVVGAFLAVNPDPFSAALHGLAVMGVCGEWAAEKSAGPGSFRSAFLDALSQVDATVLSRLRAEPYAV